MLKKKYILAVDQSTSSTKAIIFDDICNMVIRCDENHKQYYPESGWIEHDPEEIYKNTLHAIQKAINQSGVSQDDIAAVAVTNQRETVLVWDKKTGKPIYNAIVWQCLRGTETCNTLREEGWSERIESKTGLLIDPYFSATKLKWIIDNVEGVREKAESGDLVFGTIDTWIIYKLTGHKVHATDYSNACRTMLYNIYDLEWDRELLELMGLPVKMAPEVKYGDEIFGYTAINEIFERQIPVTGVMGDSHAALFGQNCFEKGMAKATYGTGSSVMMNIGHKPKKSPKGLVTSIGWGCGGEITYAFEGNIHCTGATIKWLVEDLQLVPDSHVTEEIANSVPDNNGVYLVPAFSGLGAPYWDNQAKACLCGMLRNTKRAHVVRAALESIAYRIKDVLDLMITGSGLPIKELRVDGGPTRNNFLMQFQADILRCRLARTNIEEVSALGVALMAGLSVGLWQDLDQIQTLRRVDKEFSFMMNIQTVQKNCEGWEEAVSSVLTSNRILQQDNELKIEVSNEFQKKADIRPYRRYTKHL